MKSDTDYDVPNKEGNGQKRIYVVLSKTLLKVVKSSENSIPSEERVDTIDEEGELSLCRLFLHSK